MTQVVRCEQCAGCVVYDAARDHARCLFCDSIALEPLEGDAVPIPTEALAFEVDVGRAEVAFRRWARSSWWHPRALRSLRVTVNPVWIPAWRFETQIELHWSGLVSAPTRSGRRPRAGVDRCMAHTSIPASVGLTQAELDAVQPFDASASDPWSDDGADRASVPYEVPSISEQSARKEAWALMTEARRLAVARRERLERCRASAIVDAADGRLLMLPLWIGSFRYRDRAWRFLVNAQSGQVHGRAPLDRVKVGLTLVLALLVIAAIGLWLWTHPPPRPRELPPPEHEERLAELFATKRLYPRQLSYHRADER